MLISKLSKNIISDKRTSLNVANNSDSQRCRDSQRSHFLNHYHYQLNSKFTASYEAEEFGGVLTLQLSISGSLLPYKEIITKRTCYSNTPLRN